ncbi:MAG: FMN-binding negative transcriptional regulator [Pseudomonadota bacterium]
MHQNPAFRRADHLKNLAFARSRGFAVLTVTGSGFPENPPMVSHVPFVVSEDGGCADLHLMRSNPIVRALDPVLPARLVVTGPDAYVSPDWYQIPDQVPTWNYVAVHLSGQLERRPSGELRASLDRLSAHFEQELVPKPPWSADKMTADTLSRMMRMIVPCRLNIQDIDGTWKLNQNKPDEVRLRAADEVAGSAIGSELSVLARLMRNP